MSEFLENLDTLNRIINELRDENARLREAGKEVVEWWLRGGINKFDGAHYAMFRLLAVDGESDE